MFFLFFLSPTTLAMWIKESVKIAMAQGSGFHVPWPNADPQVGEIKALPSILSKRHLWSHTLLMSSETNEWVCMWCTRCTVHEGTSCIVSLINSQWFLMIQNPLEMLKAHCLWCLRGRPWGWCTNSQAWIGTTSHASFSQAYAHCQNNRAWFQIWTPSVFCFIRKHKASTREHFVQCVMYWHSSS